MTSNVTRTPLLGRLLLVANTLSRWAIWAAGALMLITVLYIVADVILRKVANYSLHSDELSGYAFAISVSWALSFATLQRANIRIDALYQTLPIRLCAILDWVALVGLAAFIAYLTRYSLDVASLSWANDSVANTILATPLWIPQFLWVAGFAWMCVVLALMLLRASAALVHGDTATMMAVCGIRSAQQEAQEEAEAGERFVSGAQS
ncbi:MAG TPA: TRAP transporter small permease [Castellaniella sp.]|uniref:TRAP transporter small permease subunit n=1 Tax=Castellaniella sp. TaxID=1955812 RepID=UPI002EF28C2D